jgi:hypothetical protein
MEKEQAELVMVSVDAHQLLLVLVTCSLEDSHGN